MSCMILKAHEKLIIVLIWLSTDPCVKNEENRTVLHFASDFDCGEALWDVLMDAIPDKSRVADVRDLSSQRTALHYACYRNNLYAVKKLLEKKAKLSIMDAKEITPVHVAARKGRACFRY